MMTGNRFLVICMEEVVKAEGGRQLAISLARNIVFLFGAEKKIAAWLFSVFGTHLEALHLL